MRFLNRLWCSVLGHVLVPVRDHFVCLSCGYLREIHYHEGVS